MGGANLEHEMKRKKPKQTVINPISPIGNIDQRMGVHGPLNISEVESGT
jgi:hypothetical protein